MRWASVALLLCVCPALAQNAPGTEKPMTAASCARGTDFEKEGYTIRTIEVRNPFEFLPWIAPAVRDARAQALRLEGKPFKYSEVEAARDDVDSVGFLPVPPDQRVAFDATVSTVTNCSGKKLDLSYWMVSSQIKPVLTGTIESTRSEKTQPETSAGADAVTKKLRISPAAGYNRSDRMFGGGSALYDVNSASFPLGTVRMDGVASKTMHNINASLIGSHDNVTGWLAHTQWQLNYESKSEPTLDSRVGENRLAAQFSALAKSPVLLRFGASLEGGNLQGAQGSTPLANDTILGSGYGSLKLFAGTTGRWQKTDEDSLGKAVPLNTYAASYGVELGSTEAGSNLAWLKHIVDVADELIVPFGDHRWVDVEARLTGGFIQVRSAVPQAVRFLGGNKLSPFIAGNDWVIASNPLIRSIPANRFVATSEGFGGTHFVSFNSTVSLTTWRWPLVPAEVTSDPGFAEQIGNGIDIAANVLETAYEMKDRHYRAVLAAVPKVQTALDRLKSAVTAAQQSSNPQNAAMFQLCLEAVSDAADRAEEAQADHAEVQFGDVSALLSVDTTEDRLNKVREACLNQLNAQVNDPNIAATANAVEALHAQMERDFAAIDSTSASVRAAADMVYPRATLNTLLYEVNLLSVSPVVIFDVAHLGPADGRLGTRYAIGGGVRAGLVSHVEFTFGYAANPKRLPGEGKGALFVTIGLKNLFE